MNKLNFYIKQSLLLSIIAALSFSPLSAFNPNPTPLFVKSEDEASYDISLNRTVETFSLDENKYVHHIAAILDDGRTIQLDDGSAWGVGYWKKQTNQDLPIVANWQPGDRIEFYTHWKGALKVWYYITNLETQTTINAWLLHGPCQTAAHYVVDFDPEAYVILLDDDSKWMPKNIWTYYWSSSLPDRLGGHILILKVYQQDSYYLINTSTYEGSGIEVIAWE